MQQVAGRQRFWWRALDAQTSRTSATPSALRPGVSGTTSLYIPQRSRRPQARPEPLTLAIPRGERRRYRAGRRNTRGLARALLVTGLACGLIGAVLLVLPVEELRKLDIGSEVHARAEELFVRTGFGIDQVSITGRQHASDTDIYDALDLPNVRTFADFDATAVLKRIERIPWIDTAQITRTYPAGMDIVVQERTPAVIWTRGGSEYLVDATGRLLGPNPQPNQWALPRVSGEGAGKEASTLLTALQQYPQIARAFSNAERVSERRWRLSLKNGTVLELGPDRETEGFEEVVSQAMLAAAIAGPPATIDLRTLGRVTLRPATNARQKSAEAGPARSGMDRRGASTDG